MTVKIYGNGWVGKAMKVLFPDALIHDPAQGLVSEEAVDVAIICVPTPLIDKDHDANCVWQNSDCEFKHTHHYCPHEEHKCNCRPGKILDTSIVEEVVSKCDAPLILIRSTVMPGTCGKLEKMGKNIVFQPEYLGETVQHPLFDQKARPFLILGGRPENRRKIIELYQTTYNANVVITQMSLYEAEVVKLSENRAIAFKVAQCQELYDACESAKIDYYTIRDAVYHDDPRFNLWWTFVLPDKRGFNSKCIPKDVYGWAAWAESVGYIPELTNKLLKANDKLINNNPQ